MKISTPLVLASLTLASSSTLAAPTPNNGGDKGASNGMLASPNPDDRMMKSPKPSDNEWFGSNVRRAPLPAKKGKWVQKRSGNDPSSQLPALPVDSSSPDSALSGLGFDPMPHSSSMSAKANVLVDIPGAAGSDSNGSGLLGTISGIAGGLPAPIGPTVSGLIGTIGGVAGTVIGLLPSPVGPAVVSVVGSAGSSSGSTPISAVSLPAPLKRAMEHNSALPAGIDPQAALSQGLVPVMNSLGQIERYVPFSQLPVNVQAALTQAQSQVTQRVQAVTQQGGSAGGLVSGTLGQVGSSLPAPVGGVVSQVSGVVSSVTQSAGSTVQGVPGLLGGTIQQVGGQLPAPVGGAVQGLGSALTGTLSGLTGALTGTLSNVAPVAIGAVGSVRAAADVGGGPVGMASQAVGTLGSTASGLNAKLPVSAPVPMAMSGATTPMNAAQQGLSGVQNTVGSMAGKAPVPVAAPTSAIGSMASAVPNPQRVAAAMAGSDSSMTTTMMTSSMATSTSTTTMHSATSTMSTPSYAVRVRRLLAERRAIREREEDDDETWDGDMDMEDEGDDQDGDQHVFESGDEKYYDAEE